MDVVHPITFDGDVLHKSEIDDADGKLRIGNVPEHGQNFLIHYHEAPGSTRLTSVISASCSLK